MAQKLRNIAIIAHVDHGKTTLVDHLLRQSGTFRDNEAVVDRVMDSMDLERERGITILAKNTAVWFGDTKINIVDTPGHADFGGEVERVLKMVDGAMLLVDASEGPLPQTRFVLGKALEAGLEVMVCINKIDRPDARAEEVLDEVYDLFIDLGADEEQIEFPVLYACAKEGYCHLENKQEPGDLRPMLEAIISHIPAPKGDPDALPQILVTQLDHDKYVGRIAIGRIINGTVHRQQNLLLVTATGQKPVRIVQLYNYEGLARVEAATVAAGEILAIAGIDDLDIGDTLTDIENPQPLARVVVEEPTIGVLFMANDGPLAGLDGKYMTARQIRDRLEKECQTNVALKIDPDSPSDALRLFGRGELQIAILIEQMRREGWELCVSKPEVVIREQEDGTRLEPFETAELDFPEEYMGVVSEKLNLRKGRMTTMKMMGSGRVRVEFLLPARGLIGFRGEYLSDTRGQGIVNTLFAGFQPYAGHFLSRKNGSMVCDRMGQTKAYALFNLQPRGKLFVGSGTDVYEGMIVGENSRENDLNVNATKAKQLTNIRSAGADEKLILAPPLQLTLEKAMEFIADDELMEVTPNHIRLRKRVLAANMRSVVRGERKKPKKKRG
jgi:GTP-binding protein